MLAAILGAAALAPATFAPAPGWHVGAENGTTWAATTRWRDCRAFCLPHRTVTALPYDGIALQLHLAHGRGPKWERPLRWPPKLTPRAGLEGLPSRIAVVQKLGRLHGYEAYLFVFFGRPRPTERQLARARAELATLRFHAG